MASFCSFLWLPCQLWGVLVEYFIDCPSNWVGPVLSSWVDWSYGVFGSIPQRWGSLLITLYQEMSDIPMLSPVRLTMITWWRKVFARFLHCNVSIFPFYSLFFGSESLGLSWKERKVLCSYSIWNSFVREIYLFSSVQSFSHIRLFVTPWTAACQASLSITNSWSPPTQIHVHCVGDAIQPSHPLSSPSPPSLNPS